MPGHQHEKPKTDPDAILSEIISQPLKPTGESPRKPRGPKRPPRSNYQPLAVPVLDGFSMIGVGVTQGYRLVNKGRIKTFNIGRRRYATVESLQQLIAGGA